MHTAKKLRVTLGALFSAALVASCSSGGDGDVHAADSAVPTSASGAPPAEPAEEAASRPPSAFAPDAFTLTDSAYTSGTPVILHDRNAYVASESSLTTVDLASRRTLGKVTPEHPLLHAPPAAGNPAAIEAYSAKRPMVGEPVFTEINGVQVALAGFAVSGVGEPAGPGVELVAVDRGTGQEVWRFSFAVAQWKSSPPKSTASVDIVGVANGVAVLRANHDSKVTGSYGVSLAGPKLAWSNPDFHALGVDGDVVAGMAFTEGMRLTGLRVADGSSRVWQDSAQRSCTTIGTIGPWLKTGEKVDGNEVTRLVRIATQEPFAALGDALTADANCDHDADAAIVVCTEGERATAADAATGTQLWSRPAAGADAWTGKVTATFQGLLYVEDSAKNASRVVDARTGEVVQTAPGIAPVVVNEHFGVVHNGARITAHAAATP
ncbi:PQQ-binding-like beta-propeller repeat protein [Yinghuangia sp. ASG 101]|uniref:PQQ-binding-like beta-propeller repeat protein n=1 Tax=Yinghuangia sp. ASG 101 TaxID=2896848 RepID=UPI001E338792|nr:PQQ-binding-like beta-propeller repeat protein [Yinghuangia sp. ASG 101]UGQ12398.1 PQQ-binding-like beta-propeller repeat protein [Yinghuangia sp. ASG 101]